MKQKIKYLAILLLLCLIGTDTTLAQEQHWQCDPYQWEYDMTAYVTLKLNNRPVADLAGYEIAAFCGGQCRGVATVQTSENDGQTATYGYLRIRSNRMSGDDITFRVYERLTDTEYDVEDYSLTFQSQEVVGLPSSPVTLHIANVLMGDADGDGRITVNDAAITISATFGTQPDNFNPTAADMDGDGRVTINDAILIINLTL